MLQLHRHLRSSSSKAFTLIELLVVIAIIAILAAILFPVFAQAKAAAKSAVCLSDQKQIALGAIMYCNDYDDSFPLQQVVSNSPAGTNIQFWWFSITIGAPATVDPAGGFLQPYMKNFEIQGCPSAQLTNIFALYFPGTKTPVQAIGQLNVINGANASNISNVATTILTADCGALDGTASGPPATAEYGIFATSSIPGRIQGRHPNKRANVSWVDGHAKSARVNLLDSKTLLPSYAARIEQYTMGFVVPPGVGLLSDPKAFCYYQLQKTDVCQ